VVTCYDLFFEITQKNVRFISLSGNKTLGVQPPREDTQNTRAQVRAHTHIHTHTKPRPQGRITGFLRAEEEPCLSNMTMKQKKCNIYLWSIEE
jgi:hypothetical protein